MPKLHTTDMTGEIDGIVRRSLWRVVGLLCPKVVISSGRRWKRKTADKRITYGK